MRSIFMQLSMSFTLSFQYMNLHGIEVVGPPKDGRILVEKIYTSTPLRFLWRFDHIVILSNLTEHELLLEMQGEDC